jgi:hypothetical protein
MMRFAGLILVTSVLGLAGCGPTTPSPDYAIRVVPSSDGRSAMAIPPDCPRWSDNENNFFDNQPFPQFGCADARNLAAMVERPEDLLHGRELGPASGVLTAGSIVRYNNNQTRGLLSPSQQPDNSVDVTTAPSANSGLTGETPESGSSASK